LEHRDHAGSGGLDLLGKVYLAGGRQERHAAGLLEVAQDQIFRFGSLFVFFRFDEEVSRPWELAQRRFF
jgi:hypothetical protein